LSLAEGLGSMLDKSLRVTKLGVKIAEAGDSDGKPDARQIELINEAGKLMKCDLATNMVREFTELQGEVGAFYARLEGKPEEVSRAIAEHYMPKVAGGELPSSRIGAALAMADKADSLAGYFGIGQVPTGSADPYALRRSMLGLIAIHEARRPSIGIVDILSAALEGIWSESTPRPKGEILKDLEEFAAGRLRGQLLDEGHRYDLIDASMALGVQSPYAIRTSLSALEENRNEAWLPELSKLFIRVRNLAVNAGNADINYDILSEPAEISLAANFMNAAERINSILSISRNTESVSEAMRTFADMEPSISKFFEEVLVMCDDMTVKANRLALIKGIEILALKIADFSKIS